MGEKVNPDRGGILGGEGPVKVGVMGAGKISGIYLQNAGVFDDLEVVACADLVVERSEPASTSTRRSPWPSNGKTGGRCSTSPQRKASSSVAPPTPFWEAGCRPAARFWTRA